MNKEHDISNYNVKIRFQQNTQKHDGINRDVIQAEL
jgi:hypothetical protein